VQPAARDGEDALAVGLDDVGLVDAGDLDVGARVGGVVPARGRLRRGRGALGRGGDCSVGGGAHLDVAGRPEVLHDAEPVAGTQAVLGHPRRHLVAQPRTEAFARLDRLQAAGELQVGGGDSAPRRAARLAAVVGARRRHHGQDRRRGHGHGRARPSVRRSHAVPLSPRMWCHRSLDDDGPVVVPELRRRG
jgi:hypothetical protein